MVVLSTFIHKMDPTYSFSQTIRPVDKTPNTRFGFNLDFDGNTLAITSKGGDSCYQHNV